MISTGSTDVLNGGGGFGFGGGFGGIAPIGLFGVANGLFGRDLKGDCGDNSGHLAQAIYGSTVLGKLGDIEGAIPLASLQTQNSILEQTNALGNLVNQSQLSLLQASSNVKDAVTNTGTALLVNANNNTQEIISAINGVSSKIDQNRISELESMLAETRFHGRSREVEVNVTQQVNQQQAQAQQQAQFGQLVAAFNNLAGDIQAVKQSTSNINFGVMGSNQQNPTATNNTVK